MALAFDTHKYIKRLTAVGMPEPQAEVIAYEQRSLIEDQLATKQDVKESEAATRREIKELEAATRREIKESEAATRREIAATRREIKELEANTRRDLKELEQRLTIRLGGMMIAGFSIMIAGFGVIASLIKLP